MTQGLQEIVSRWSFGRDGTDILYGEINRIR